MFGSAVAMRSSMNRFRAAWLQVLTFFVLLSSGLASSPSCLRRTKAKYRATDDFFKRHAKRHVVFGKPYCIDARMGRAALNPNPVHADPFVSFRQMKDIGRDRSDNTSHRASNS